MDVRHHSINLKLYTMYLFDESSKPQNYHGHSIDPIHSGHMTVQYEHNTINNVTFMKPHSYYGHNNTDLICNGQMTPHHNHNVTFYNSAIFFYETHQSFNDVILTPYTMDL